MTGVCTISSFWGSQHSSNKIKRMKPRFSWISRTKWEEKGKAPGSVADLLTTNQVAHCPVDPVSMPSVFRDLKYPKLIYDQLSRCSSKPTETTGDRSVNRYLLFPLGEQILLSGLKVEKERTMLMMCRYTRVLPVEDPKRNECSFWRWPNKWFFSANEYEINIKGTTTNYTALSMEGNYR